MEVKTIDIKTPEELSDVFKNIDDKYLTESRKKLNEEYKENSKILESHNKDSFELRKDLLILVGTIFGSSIALSTGRNVNTIFIIGEFFLFLSLTSGLIYLTVHLKAKEWDYAFSSKNSLDSYLLTNKTKIEKFERKSLEDLIEDYKKIMKANQSGILYTILKKIPVDKWPDIFTTTFLLGVLLILSSLVPNLNLVVIICSNFVQ